MKQDSNRPPRFALPEVVGVALSAEELAAIVQSSVQEMARALDCDRMVVLSYLPREQLLRGVTIVGVRDDMVRLWKWSVHDFPAAERAIRTGQILPLAASAVLPEEFAHHFPGPRVLVPLRLGQRPLAVLVGLLRKGISARATSWQKRAREVAERAALVVELERVASAYQDEKRLRAATREIAAAILEGRPLAEIASLLTGFIADRLGEDRVALFYRDKNGTIAPLHLRNVPAEYGEAVTRVTRHGRPAVRTVATGLPYLIRDVQSDPGFTPEVRALFRTGGVHAILITPLHYRDQVNGVLAIYPRDQREFTPAELNLVQAFSDMATIAVAISQLLEAQRDMAMMQERNRLAIEMHDTVAQSLTGLLLQIETARNLMVSSDLGAARDMLAEAYQQARRALEDTRRAVQGLSPALLESLSPEQAIRAEVGRFQQETGIVAQFVLSGEERALTSDQETALLRIAQEALNNVRKHAHASRVRAGLHFGTQDVVLIVEDDGQGFEVSAGTPGGTHRGYGLFGMSERARLLGGELVIDSMPGWGTRVQARLPYQPPASHSFRDSPLLQVAPAETRGDVDTERDVRTQETQRLRVLIADDHAVTRQGVRAMLEATGEVVVVGEAEDGAQVLEMARTLDPDVVLMDIRMPRMDGVEALRRIREIMPALPVVILTATPPDEVIVEVLELGVQGFWLKDASAVEIRQAVKAAFQGQSSLAPFITQRVASLASAQKQVRQDIVLSEREREVLEGLARGMRNREIARQLFITPKTVEYHLSNLYVKLGVSNRTEAIRAAIDRGLIQPVSRK
ncbi:MAG: response regulator [Chloroherpetonaceae bacterium]|nr:response regulator [Chthonomonadaceae bacterium]MDW8208296.1 response regulator [Chloroherpetonaceae bacterium]